MTIHPAGALLIAGVLLLGGGWLFWPDTGLLARWRARRRLTGRVLQEDALKRLYTMEIAGKICEPVTLSGALQLSRLETAALLGDLREEGLIESEVGVLTLTPAGRDIALHVIRAHRLWEKHLAEETGHSETEWHVRAERWEHDLTPAELDQIALRLGNPTHDPHGDPIPTPSGDLPPIEGVPLTDLDESGVGTIVHLEDEPKVVYAQLVAEGLQLGMPVRIVEKRPDQIRFWANGDEHILAPVLAHNISVVERELNEPKSEHGPRLSSLNLGESAVVTRLSPACRGAERRRFMDLGILPGTTITAEIRSPGGDPTGYRIRGATIALRKVQADLVHIAPEIPELTQSSTLEEVAA